MTNNQAKKMKPIPNKLSETNNQIKPQTVDRAALWIMVASLVLAVDRAALHED